MDNEGKKGNVASKEIYFKIGLCEHIYKTHKKLKKLPSDSVSKQKKITCYKVGGETAK